MRVAGPLRSPTVQVGGEGWRGREQDSSLFARNVAFLQGVQAVLRDGRATRTLRRWRPAGPVRCSIDLPDGALVRVVESRLRRQRCGCGQFSAGDSPWSGRPTQYGPGRALTRYIGYAPA